MSRQEVGVGGRNLVQMVPPQSVSNALVTSNSVDITEFDRLGILIELGAVDNSLNSELKVYGATSSAGANAKLLGTIKWRLNTGTGWGDRVETADKLTIKSGGDIDVDDNQSVLIEVDAADIEALADHDHAFVYFTISAGGAHAYLVSATALLSKGRYSTQ